MSKDSEVINWLKKNGNEEHVAGMSSYGIPSTKAIGVPMGAMKVFAKTLGKDHALALSLWKSGFYEARILAVFVAESERLTEKQMDAWVKQFDSWAICDAACFHLFDRTPYAWHKLEAWDSSSHEFVRRAAYALIWALTVHDKAADNAKFRGALSLIGASNSDDRPLVNKSINMALRAIGKRNLVLNKAAIKTAMHIAQSDNKARAWIGSHALRELNSDKVQARLKL